MNRHLFDFNIIEHGNIFASNVNFIVQFWYSNIGRDRVAQRWIILDVGILSHLKFCYDIFLWQSILILFSLRRYQFTLHFWWLQMLWTINFYDFLQQWFQFMLTPHLFAGDSKFCVLPKCICYIFTSFQASFYNVQCEFYWVSVVLNRNCCSCLKQFYESNLWNFVLLEKFILNSEYDWMTYVKNAIHLHFTYFCIYCVCICVCVFIVCWVVIVIE